MIQEISTERLGRVIAGMDPHFDSATEFTPPEATESLDRALRAIVRTVPWQSG